MKTPNSPPYIIQTISELHCLFALPKPEHPLVSVIDFELISFNHSGVWRHFAADFYFVVLKKGSSGRFKYGQREYDFDSGLMSFTKPGQIFSVTDFSDEPVNGYMLVFKAEFIHPCPLMNAIKNYGFFAYSVSESLHLSEKEEAVISSLFGKMQQELGNNIDPYSQDVLISYIDLLLKYANRFHGRQFITRRNVNNELVIKLEEILDSYFEDDKNSDVGRPTVHMLAQELNVSVNYLSDMLRSMTGYNTQQYIHHYQIEKAKELLVTTNLNVNEIAYRLGFDYSQSFNKLFKKKTSKTPLEYRASLN